MTRSHNRRRIAKLLRKERRARFLLWLRDTDEYRAMAEHIERSVDGYYLRGYLLKRPEGVRIKCVFKV